MDPKRWKRVEAIRNQTLGLGANERATFLDKACAGDRELRSDVEALMSEDAATQSGLPNLGVRKGDRIAHYRLLEKIGEGGMGVVWLAEQEKPIRRRVALKLIKLGMDTNQVIARFEAERQALALMNHANVAKVLDAGATDDGRPFFAMEYVKGERITDYCDKHRLSIEQRLVLFAQVCEGVQHAHQKGVIHRDIKPSNVLVTHGGESPTPKIIDFGVAKATEQKLTERTLYTQIGTMIGTPDYMSPEQAEMSGLDIDTRSDVYSLGVLLYVLVVGALPFDPTELREAGLDEIRRKIREDLLPRPSMRWSTLGAEQSLSVAEKRSVDPHTLRRKLQGDLDWIVMRALEKDRTRRYGSPVQMATDIALHLRDEPVSAGPPTVVYRMRKFVRRNRVAVGIASAMLATLVLGFGGTTIGLLRARAAESLARHEAAMAGRVAEFLGDVIGGIDPQLFGAGFRDDLRMQLGQSASNATSRSDLSSSLELFDELMSEVNTTDPAVNQIAEILGWAAERIHTEFNHEPAIAGELEHTLGRTYLRLSLLDQARPHILRAVKYRASALGRDHRRTLAAEYLLANLCQAADEKDEALRIYEEVLERQQRVLGLTDRDTLKTMSSLGALQMNMHRFEKAHEVLARTLTLQEQALGANHLDTLDTARLLGELHSQKLDLATANEIFRDVLVRARRSLGEEHEIVIRTLQFLGRNSINQGRYQDAAQFLEEAGVLSRRVNGGSHTTTLGVEIDLGRLYTRRGSLDSGETVLTRAVGVLRGVVGASHVVTILATTELAANYYRQNRFGEAESLLRANRDRARLSSGIAPLYYLHNNEMLALVYLMQERYALAEKVLRETLELRRALHGDEHPAAVYGTVSLAYAHERQGHYERADAVYSEIDTDSVAEAISQDISVTHMLNDLSWYLNQRPITTLQSRERALKYAQMANDQTLAENGNFMDTLAFAYCQVGDRQRAIDTQRRAVELVSDDTAQAAKMRRNLNTYLDLTNCAWD